MKVSKKTGIALFVTAAVIMAVLIVFHKNPGPAADPGQELAKKQPPASGFAVAFRANSVLRGLPRHWRHDYELR